MVNRAALQSDSFLSSTHNQLFIGCLGYGADMLPAEHTIRELLNSLQRTDLTPSAHVDALLADLTTAATSMTNGVEHLDPAMVHVTRQVVAAGTAQLEHHWAELICTNQRTVTEYPHWHTYRSMVAAETELITRRHGQHSQVAFVGCGALPLSGLLLASAGFHVTCFDKDADTAQRAQNVINHTLKENACHTTQLSFRQGCAHTSDLSSFGVVILAASAGDSTPAKRELLEHLGATLTSGTLLAARSVPADGRALLHTPCPYPVTPTLNFCEELTPPAPIPSSLATWRVAPHVVILASQAEPRAHHR